MTVGTKSILFGVHHWLWHPITVTIAWTKLYGRPTWRELVCIIIHDLGYWGSPNMDGKQGEWHPKWAAVRANKWWGGEYGYLCLLHSRHLAKHLDMEPSKLCWADKYSHAFYPVWLYLLLARLSGELSEYREESAACGFMPLIVSDREWFVALRGEMRKMAKEKTAGSMPYHLPATSKDEVLHG